jgi:hypothetical protein
LFVSPDRKTKTVEAGNIRCITIRSDQTDAKKNGTRRTIVANGTVHVLPSPPIHGAVIKTSITWPKGRFQFMFWNFGI